MGIDFTSLFTLPTKVYWGRQSADMAGTEAKRLRIQKALVVTDKGVRDAGVTEPVLQSLASSGVSYEVFDEVPEDPDSQVIAEGVDLLKQTGSDGVFIVGGGSALCAGKGIALVASNGGDIRDYEGFERYRTPPLPAVGVPTTAGSGSEVSAVFLISDEKRGSQKMAIGGHHIYPEAAILDPLLLRTLPARQMIISGMDALTHAMEATWTNQATCLTDAIAYEAIRMIKGNLVAAAYTDGLDAKGKQLFASTMANIACGNAKLGLVHGVSQSLEAYHLPHGLSVGILLPYVMEYNLPVCEEKMARLAEVVDAVEPGMKQAEKAGCGIAAVKELFTRLDFPDRVPQDVVPRKDVPKLAKEAMGRPQVSSFNLRKASEKDIVALLERAYDGWR